MAGLVTFDTTPPLGTVNMGIGMPSADLLPLELLRQASDAFFAGANSSDLNYGVVEGDRQFLETLAAFLSRGYDSQVDPDSLFLSAGNSQALDFVTSVFAADGDTIFVEEPSYFLAFQVFRDHGLNIVGIPVDDQGISTAHVKKALEHHRPRLLYTIPSFHNPSGRSTSYARRQELVTLSQHYDFKIVADEVYQLLSFYEPPPPAYATLIDSGTVLSLGSFSKILAPALRLGWIQCAPNLRTRLAAAGLPNSGGCLNRFGSHLARAAIESGLQAAHLEEVRIALRARSEAMNHALHQHFGDIASWQKQLGGYFYWLEFDRSIDTTELKPAAARHKTGFQPGRVFSSQHGLENCLRLAFSHYNEDDIAAGVARLRRLFAE